MLKLIIDTREQLPLEFLPGVFDEVVREGMPVADYWAELDGEELPICFERKSLGDLYGTMTSGYERFKKNIAKAKEFNLKMILLIEGTMRDCAKGFKHSSFDGGSMLKKLAMLHVKYDLEYHFGDRRELARRIEETFDAVKRHYKKTKEQ